MATAYTDMNDADLMRTLSEKRAELREFRFDIAGTKAKNVKEARHIKREIARILTEYNTRHVTK